MPLNDRLDRLSEEAFEKRYCDSYYLPCIMTFLFFMNCLIVEIPYIWGIRVPVLNESDMFVWTSSEDSQISYTFMYRTCKTLFPEPWIPPWSFGIISWIFQSYSKSKICLMTSLFSKSWIILSPIGFHFLQNMCHRFRVWKFNHRGTKWRFQILSMIFYCFMKFGNERMHNHKHMLLFMQAIVMPIRAVYYNNFGDPVMILALGLQDSTSLVYDNPNHALEMFLLPNLLVLAFAAASIFFDLMLSIIQGLRCASEISCGKFLS